MKIKNIINPNTIAGAALLNIILSIIVMAMVFGIFLTYKTYNQKESTIRKTKKRYTQFYKKIILNDINYVHNFIKDKRSNAEKMVKASINDHVLNASSIANHIYSINKETDQSQLMLEIKEALRPIHWGNKEYFFILNNTGSYVLNTEKPELETLISTDIKLIKENMEMVQIAETHGSGFYKYKEKDPIKNIVNPSKLVFVQQFKPFDWVLGASTYLSDTERNIKEEVLSRIAEMGQGKNRYLFVLQDNGLCLYHPLEKFNKKFLLDYTAKDGERVIAKLIDTTKTNKNGDYYQYFWENPASDKIAPKISFIVNIKGWKWTVGTGVYLEDMEQAIEIENLNYEKGLKNNLIAIFLI
ncbi:MAG: cache domain-containing protein, partial [Desulfobacteraceae bacterium]|nr:cache domain-containing protein [Desulfobacteraceae bacterium]